MYNFEKSFTSLSRILRFKPFKLTYDSHTFGEEGKSSLVSENRISVI